MGALGSVVARVLELTAVRSAVAVLAVPIVVRGWELRCGCVATVGWTAGGCRSSASVRVIISARRVVGCRCAKARAYFAAPVTSAAVARPASIAVVVLATVRQVGSVCWTSVSRPRGAAMVWTSVRWAAVGRSGGAAMVWSPMCETVVSRSRGSAVVWSSVCQAVVIRACGSTVVWSSVCWTFTTVNESGRSMSEAAMCGTSVSWAVVTWASERGVRRTSVRRRTAKSGTTVRGTSVWGTMSNASDAGTSVSGACVARCVGCGAISWSSISEATVSESPVNRASVTETTVRAFSVVGRSGVSRPMMGGCGMPGSMVSRRGMPGAVVSRTGMFRSVVIRASVGSSGSSSERAGRGGRRVSHGRWRAKLSGCDTRRYSRCTVLRLRWAVDSTRHATCRAGAFWYHVELRVEVVQRGCLVALEVVPPVANEESLVKDGAVGAEERVVSAVFLADVEDLALCVHVTVVTSIFLILAAESSAWNGVVDRIVLPSRSPDSGPHLAIVSVVLPIVAWATTNVLTGLRTTVWEAIGDCRR